MRDSLEQKRGLKVSDITIWRALRRVGYSLKQVWRFDFGALSVDNYCL